MLQTFNVPIGGRIVNAKATFFRYESSGVAGADETVRLRADGNDLGTYLPGDSIELPVDASTWEVTPASPTQTCIVRLGVGRINTARLVGLVTVTNKVSASVAATFGNGVLTVGSNATQIIAPATNLRGVLVRRASTSINGNSGTTQAESRMLVAPVVPSTSVPAQSYQIVGATVAGATSQADVRNDMNYQLPAGWGVWLFNFVSGAAAASCFYEFTYELL